ncbi:MAG: 16S rRNA (uracil(1498)-N(3))-methyltransferase [Ruminococcus sp.]|nr:16S rRNA (uracil(1498)-N(3))-methyltransferase [Ruminococcus sp.]
MPKFFVGQICGTQVQITGTNARHIGLSLQMCVGDSLVVSADWTDYQCQIRQIAPECVDLDVIAAIEDTAEPSIVLTLYQALQKTDKFVQIVQKAVELGAARIVPMQTQRCVSRPSKADFAKKLQRLQRIAESAAKQSGRSAIPEVAPLYTLQEVCDELASSDHALLLYEGGGKHFSEFSLESRGTVVVLVGSEGGFSPEEAVQITQSGAVPVWLGKRILRCETAPLAAIAVVMHRTGNL